jgi:hypothetical protein
MCVAKMMWSNSTLCKLKLIGFKVLTVVYRVWSTGLQSHLVVTLVPTFQRNLLPPVSPIWSTHVSCAVPGSFSSAPSVLHVAFFCAPNMEVAGSSQNVCTCLPNYRMAYRRRLSLYKTGRVKHIRQVSLSRGVQQHMRRNSAKHLVHGYPTFSWQRTGSWTTCVKIKVSGIPNHLYYVIFIVCVCVGGGCRPHNTTWRAASWRPMVYITGCSEMWNSAVV